MGDVDASLAGVASEHMGLALNGAGRPASLVVGELILGPGLVLTRLEGLDLSAGLSSGYSFSTA
jgi:hypothetical protein